MCRARNTGNTKPPSLHAVRTLQLVRSEEGFGTHAYHLTLALPVPPKTGALFSSFTSEYAAYAAQTTWTELFTNFLYYNPPSDDDDAANRNRCENLYETVTYTRKQAHTVRCTKKKNRKPSLARSSATIYVAKPCQTLYQPVSLFGLQILIKFVLPLTLSATPVKQRGMMLMKKTQETVPRKENIWPFGTYTSVCVLGSRVSNKVP